MDLNNIERNQLDYILTDVLPTELSGQFTYRYFYEYLNTRNSDLFAIAESIKKTKYENKKVFTDSKGWASMPLIYTIMKQLDTERSISLLQPLGAIQLYMFISAYQKELLTLLQKNAVFSIRYHRKNNDLYYKSKNKSVIKYFDDLSDNTGKEIIEQTGMYFDIGPYKSITAFTSSEDWLVLNSKYKSFIRADYKACFDSIYTHTFKWIIGKDVNDTKHFKNGSIYTTIDTVLMNINAKTSNGIVVGPEFSRMVAELLLQAIDRDVFSMLLNRDIIADKNYNIFRYVDDIFIFAESDDLADEILALYSQAARKYLLRLNEEKLFSSKVPFILEPWLNETNLFTNRTSSLLFYTKDEQKSYVSSHSEYILDSIDTAIMPHLIKSSRLVNRKKSIMTQFNELICRYESKRQTIVAYFLGMLLNKVGRNKDSVMLFKDNVSETTVFSFLELAFYAYSFFPNFNNTQRLLSIIGYIKDEFDIYRNRERLQKLLEKYAFVFEKSNLNDIINLILFCHQAKIEIPYRQEKMIVEKLAEKDDPILWASYLLYTQYSEEYYNEIKNRIGRILDERIDAIVKKDSICLYREFWWILIFNKSPHLTAAQQSRIDAIIPSISTGATSIPGKKVVDLFVEFLEKSENQFFEWEIDKSDFLRNITFKTRQRSIFKNYQEDLQSLYWSSI